MNEIKSLYEKLKDEPETKGETYRLVILSHDEADDPNETGILIRKRAEELGLDVLLGEFIGAYTKKVDGKRYIYSFKVDEKGNVIIPDPKQGAVYDEPFEIDQKNTLIMVRGLGTSGLTGNRSWTDIIRILEYEGFFVINSTNCHAICSDKWMNQIVFERNNFRIPKTIRINHPEGAEEAVKELDIDYPLILKTATGSRGIGVMWIESYKALSGIVQLLYRQDEWIDILLQEYIKTDYDVRVIVCAGKVVGVMKRPVVEGDYRSNVSQGSEPETHELTKLEESESIRAAEAVEGMVVGVDFIPAKNREKESPYFIEVNSTPGLIGIEKTLEKNYSITTEILKRFFDKGLWKKSDNE